MPSSVSNAVLSKQIEALAQAVTNRANTEQPATEGWQAEVREQLLTLGLKQDALSALVKERLSKEFMADACPYRDDIRRAANNLGRIGALEVDHKTLLQNYNDLKLKVAVTAAKYAGLTSLIVSVTGFVVMMVGQRVGWW